MRRNTKAQSKGFVEPMMPDSTHCENRKQGQLSIKARPGAVDHHAQLRKESKPCARLRASDGTVHVEGPVAYGKSTVEQDF